MTFENKLTNSTEWRSGSKITGFIHRMEPIPVYRSDFLSTDFILNQVWDSGKLV